MSSIWQFVGSSGGICTPGATTVSIPAGAIAGDSLIVVVIDAEGGPDLPVSLPTGWDTLTVLHTDDEIVTGVYRKTFDSGDPVSFVFSAGNATAAVILIYRGLDDTAALVAQATVDCAEDGTPTNSFPCPNIALDHATDLYLGIMCTLSFDAVQTSPAGCTDVFSETQTRPDTGDSVKIVVVDRDFGASGAVGVQTFTTSTTPDNGVAVSLALKAISDGSGAEVPTVRYDPPGAIGLDPGVILLRFNEVLDGERVRDARGALEDFDPPPAPFTYPTVVEGVLGRARLFDASHAIVSHDKVSGTTLLTRDVSIQTCVSWDFVNQHIAGTAGTILARGDSASVPQYVAYGLEFNPVTATIGEVRLFWQDIAGVMKIQQGGRFSPYAGFAIFTATRRWIGPTSVRIRYYAGSRLLGQFDSADGSIGGGTLGTMFVGAAGDGFGGLSGRLIGTIDELAVYDRELCAEEVEDTVLRITDFQPRGVRLFREMFDKGFPVTDERDSDVQRDIIMAGQALGYSAAKIDNIRRNFLPTRAYGTTLEQWEEATRVTPTPAQDIETRRKRVLARFRQRRGCSIDGIRDSLIDAIDTDVANLQFIAYNNTELDTFDTLDTLQWDITPTGAVVSHLGAARFALGAGTYLAPRSWVTIAQGVSQSGRPGVLGEEHALAQVAMTSPSSGAEAGVWFGDRAVGNYVLLGLRDVAGSFKIVTEAFNANVSAGAVVQATLGANPATLWLHLHETAGQWIAEWSTTSRTTGYAVSRPFAGATLMYWSGCYVRSTGAIGATVVDFADYTLRTPKGTRAFNAYVLLDPALGGTPDLDSANQVVKTISHAFIHSAVIRKRAFSLGDPDSKLGVCPFGP